VRGLALALAVLGPACLYGSASATPPGKPAFRAELSPALIEGAESFAESEGAARPRDIQAVATTLGQAAFVEPGGNLPLAYHRPLHGSYGPGDLPVDVVELETDFPHGCTETLGETTDTCASGNVLELEYVAKSLELLRVHRWTRYRDLRHLGTPVRLKPQHGMPADVRANLLRAAGQYARELGDSAPADIRAVLTTEAKLDGLLHREPGRSATGEPVYVAAMRGDFNSICEGGPALEGGAEPGPHGVEEAGGCSGSGSVLELSIVPREAPYYSRISDEYPDLAALGVPLPLERPGT
jgi:hypothetical protein